MAPLSCECSLHTRLLATSSLSSLIFSTLRISVHSFWLSLTRVVACVSISWHAVSSVDFSPSPCSARVQRHLESSRVAQSRPESHEVGVAWNRLELESSGDGLRNKGL
uniref:Uncharacterized protein n=1 Tax=Anopheles coluzzii TaxID=1518534 RepID=A0A8W7PAZ6_ANOCL